MKTFQQFQIDVHQLDEGKLALGKIAFKGLSKLTNSMRAGPAIKHLRTPFNKPVRMYHGTLKTASNQIMNKGFTPTQTVNPKTLSTELSNVYLTTNPKRAEHYANLMAKTKKGKADIVAVNVNKTKNMRKGVRGDEFVVPVKDTIPTAQGVKPIKRRKGEVIQDNYQYIKEARVDKLLKYFGDDAIKVLRNKRFLPKIVNQDGANKLRLFKHLKRRGVSGKFPNFTPKDTPDKYSKLAIKRKSIYPPDVDAAETQIGDMRIDIGDKKIARQIEKARKKAERMYKG